MPICNTHKGEMRNASQFQTGFAYVKRLPILVHWDMHVFQGMDACISVIKALFAIIHNRLLS